MSVLNNVQLDDLERLSREISGYSSDVGEWSVKVGLDPDVVDGMGNVAANMARDRAVEMARKEIEESGILDEVGEGDGMALRMDIGELVKSACLSMFVLGFETHKQYGGGGVRR